MKHPLKRLLHYYIYDMKLKKKLAVSYAILFMLPMAVVTVLMFTRFFQIVLNNTLQSEEAFHAQSALAAENLMTHISYASDTLTDALSVQGLFSIPKEQAKTSALSRSQLDSLYNQARMAAEPSLIRSVRIYYDDSSYPRLDVWNNGRQILFSPLSSLDSQWISQFKASEEDYLFCSSSLSETERETCGNLAYITRLNYLPQNGETERETAAYVAVYFSRSSLQELIANRRSIEGEYTFFADQNGRTIQTGDLKTNKSMPAIPPELFEQLKTEEEFLPAELNGIRVYAACFPVKDSGWYLISLIPREKLQAVGASTIMNFIGLYAFISLLALFLAYLLSRSFADRIIHVALQMESIRSGRPQPLILEQAGNDEIGILSGAYNFMTAEINELMDQQEQASKELQRAQFRALQAQINPHFLYNTLDMINWLAQSGQTGQVSEAIQALTRFYRLTLGRKDLLSSIRDEITHVSLYMQLQNMRYNHCASFIADVPPELLDFTIPKLTFQPIVENALLHGILMKEEKKGSILLTGWREDNDIILVICDDGAGIPPEKLDTLLDEPNTEGALTSTRHIGVSNTNLRLKSLYGEGFGLSFTSVTGKGTEVTLKIPAMQERMPL